MVAAFVYVEALVLGEVSFVAEMPFAGVEGLVAFVAEGFGESGFA